jgi:hypothetical protein
MLVALLCAASIYGLANSSAFRYVTLRIEGGTYTSAYDVEAALGAIRGVNLFALDTGPLVEEITRLDTVQGATVDVRLPGMLVVRLEERTPILVWRVGERRYLSDPDGVLFTLLDEDSPPAAATLPIVDDLRAASIGLGVGRQLARVDLDAATRLASLTAADVGSSADSLRVTVSDQNGFVLRSVPDHWVAIFGYYTASLRTPDLIPGQVRLLRSLLIGREPTIEQVILASETDGTYIVKSTPEPTPTAGR